MPTRKRKHSESEDDSFEIVHEQSDVEPDITDALAGDIEASDVSSSDDEKAIMEDLSKANKKGKKSGGFQSMGLSHPTHKAILQKGFKVPTPIQRKTVPVILQGQDLVGMARTGSGKTAAFVIPLIEKLKTHSAKVGARGLILSPSRELALQTLKVVKELGKFTDLRAVVLVGGDSLEEQFSMMATNPDILIATPGRLLHLAVEMDLDMKSIEYVVFDEADRLFEMGFSVQLHELLHRLPPTRQTLLFSATLPKSLVDFAKAGLQDPTLVRLDVESKISSDLEMAFFHVKSIDKEAALLYILRQVIKVPLASAMEQPEKSEKKGKKPRRPSRDLAPHQTIVFASTKHHVEYLAAMLDRVGYAVSYIYGALDQLARKIQIEKFSTGESTILVVTDVAARGIDLPMLQNVINYDFVDTSKVFVHRVGRTARAGRKGWAYSLVTTAEIPHLLDLQLFLARPLITPDKVAGKEIAYNANIVTGSIPREQLDTDVEWVTTFLDDVNMASLLKVAKNGYKMYQRSRPTASQESHKRSKELLADEKFDPVHPLLLDGDAQTESQRMDLLSTIASYRPTETVFEVGHRGQKKTNEAAQIMRQRRQTLGKRIANAQEKKQKRSIEGDELAAVAPADPESDVDLDEAFGNGKSDYRDNHYYMSHYQKGANTEKGYSVTNGGTFAQMANAASMDLVGDDADGRGPRETNKGLHWDAKKKKFVQGDGTGSDNKKLITSESGQKIPASFKAGRFSDWQKAHKMSLPRTGEEELKNASSRQGRRFKHNKVSSAKPLDPLRNDYERKKRARVEQDKDGNGKAGKLAKPELKSVDQIHKQRKLKQKRREKNARPSRKRKL